MCRWEDSVIIDLKEICINTRNWFDFVGALVNAALNLWVPYAMELDMCTLKLSRDIKDASPVY